MFFKQEWRNIFHFYYKLKFVQGGVSKISASDFEFKNIFTPLHCSCHTKADWIEKLLSLFELVIVSNFSTPRIYFQGRKLASIIEGKTYVPNLSCAVIGISKG